MESPISAYRIHGVLCCCSLGPDQWLIHFEDCLGNVQSPIAIETSQVVYDPSLGAFDFAGYDESQGVLLAVNIGKTGSSQ